MAQLFLPIPKERLPVCFSPLGTIRKPIFSPALHGNGRCIAIAKFHATARAKFKRGSRAISSPRRLFLRQPTDPTAQAAFVIEHESNPNSSESHGQLGPA